MGIFSNIVEEIVEAVVIEESAEACQFEGYLFMDEMSTGMNNGQLSLLQEIQPIWDEYTSFDGFQDGDPGAMAEEMYSAHEAMYDALSETIEGLAAIYELWQDTAAFADFGLDF